MAELNIETVIKSGVEKALNKPIADGKSITEWAAIGMKAPRWVSVEDRLPEERGRYLCWFGKNVFCVGADIATYLPEWHGFGRLETDTVLQNITHWMPLPEPPEEVGNDED